MAQTRTRLTHPQLAAPARHAFGLAPDAPEFPPATDFEDAEGVLVARTDERGALTVREIPRWRSPDSVRAELATRGWSEPAAWVGRPPEDVSGLPDRLLVLLPVAGTAPDSPVLSPPVPAVLSLGAAVWPALAADRELVVVPVPVTAAEPEMEWVALAAAYGAG